MDAGTEDPSMTSEDEAEPVSSKQKDKQIEDLIEEQHGLNS